MVSPMRTADEHAVSSTIITLMRGVVYRETSEDAWTTLERQGAAVPDHFPTIGVEGGLDAVEGEESLPRLVHRRQLTYNVSLLLVLLRKRLVEFETTGGDGKLVLTKDQILELLRVFLADSTNEARIVDRVDTTIAHVADLGF